MGQRVRLGSKLKPLGVGAAKASLNRALERTEPTPVEKVGDDLWLGVKGQSRPAIAGSPRNLLR